MDGIDLDIEGGDYKNYPEFITELRMLMDNDQTKNYLITGAPQCPYPDHHLGPEKPGSGKTYYAQDTLIKRLLFNPAKVTPLSLILPSTICCLRYENETEFSF